MKPLEFGLSRQLLQHKELYNGQCVPFFRKLHPHALTSCLGLTSRVAQLAMPNTKTINGLQDAIRAVPNEADKIPIGMEALQWLRHVQRRLDASAHKSLTEVPYEFEVGDIVRHKRLGHLGVVAAQLPVCFASDEWLQTHLGSTCDQRLQHPWYLILVSHHHGLPLDFSRYGSQLTHERVAGAKSIGFNRNLPIFFTGFDAEKGVYVPKARPKLVNPTKYNPSNVSKKEVDIPALQVSSGSARAAP